jgi:hypothetical protein
MIGAKRILTVTGAMAATCGAVVITGGAGVLAVTGAGPVAPGAEGGGRTVPLSVADAWVFPEAPSMPRLESVLLQPAKTAAKMNTKAYRVVFNGAPSRLFSLLIA